jgi:phage tail sheath protein FI
MTTYGRPGVYINELPLNTAPINGAAAASAAGAVLGAFAKGPNAVTLVTSWYEFTKRFGGYNAAYPATFAVGSFFKNGGTELYVRRILPANAGTASVAIPIDHEGSDDLIVLESSNKGADGNNLRVKFTKSGTVRGNDYYDLTVYVEAGVPGTITGGVVTAGSGDDIIVEQFNGLVFNDPNSSDFIETVLGYGSSYLTVEPGSVDITDTYGPVLDTIYPLSGATTDEDDLIISDYTGDTGELEVVDAYTVLAEFDNIDQPLVVFSGDVVKQLGWTDAQVVYNSMIDWAEATKKNFIVVETSAGKSAVQALTEINGLNSSSRAAAYYPHILVRDPLGKSGDAIRKVGPSGAVAGLFLATDSRIGPFKTPAGIESKVTDAIAIERAFTPAELDALNTGDANDKNPINAIRNLPGAGIVVMGGRTLKQDGTANRYVSMRRSLIYIEKRLRDLTQFALFENNSELLWDRIVTVLGTFLNEYRNRGGLRGTTTDVSYYVKCDAENNTPASIANGEVHVEVGVALEYPAEFVVINLSQKTAN